jgi:hypothetical protein
MSLFEFSNELSEIILMSKEIRKGGKEPPIENEEGYPAFLQDALREQVSF